MKNERIFHVYVDLRNRGKDVFYVGKGTMARVKQPIRVNNRWMNIVKKEGGYMRKVVHSNLTHEEACKIEVELISKYGREKLANTSNGGDGAGVGNRNSVGQKLSPEGRVRKSLKMKGNKHLLGHRHSEETKKKQSFAGKAWKVEKYIERFHRRAIL